RAYCRSAEGRGLTRSGPDLARVWRRLGYRANVVRHVAFSHGQMPAARHETHTLIVEIEHRDFVRRRVDDDQRVRMVHHVPHAPRGFGGGEIRTDVPRRAEQSRSLTQLFDRTENERRLTTVVVQNETDEQIAGHGCAAPPRASAWPMICTGFHPGSHSL